MINFSAVLLTPLLNEICWHRETINIIFPKRFIETRLFSSLRNLFLLRKFSDRKSSDVRKIDDSFVFQVCCDTLGFFSGHDWDTHTSFQFLIHPSLSKNDVFISLHWIYRGTLRGVRERINNVKQHSIKTLLNNFLTNKFYTGVLVCHSIPIAFCSIANFNFNFRFTIVVDASRNQVLLHSRTRISHLHKIQILSLKS